MKYIDYAAFTRKISIAIYVIVPLVVFFFVWQAANEPSIVFLAKTIYYDAFHENKCWYGYANLCSSTVRFENIPNQGIEKERADRFLKYLDKNFSYEAGTTTFFVVRKKGRTYEFLYPIQKGLEMDEDIVRTFKAEGKELSDYVFDAQPVTIHMCDPFLNTIRVVIPQLGFKSQPVKTVAEKNQDLLQAALWGDSEEVKRLLNQGADVNAKDKDGRTALMAAAYKARVESLKLLIDGGADVNAKDVKGRTALITASWEGHLEAMELLVYKGAEINTKDNDGNTSLMMASRNGSYKVVKSLLDKGADVDAKDKADDTALMKASRFGHCDVVKALLDRGADVTTQNNYGSTALSLASRDNYRNVVNLLKAHGAKK